MPEEEKPKESKKAPSGWGPMDVLFVLFCGLFCMFLFLWAAGQLAGRDVFGDLPGWAVTAVSSVWTWLTGAAGAIVFAFLRKKKVGSSPNPLWWILGIGVGGPLFVLLLANLMPG